MLLRAELPRCSASTIQQPFTHPGEHSTISAHIPIENYIVLLFINFPMHGKLSKYTNATTESEPSSSVLAITSVQFYILPGVGFSSLPSLEN